MCRAEIMRLFSGKISYRACRHAGLRGPIGPLRRIRGRAAMRRYAGAVAPRVAAHARRASGRSGDLPAMRARFVAASSRESGRSHKAQDRGEQERGFHYRSPLRLISPISLAFRPCIGAPRHARKRIPWCPAPGIGPCRRRPGRPPSARRRHQPARR